MRVSYRPRGETGDKTICLPLPADIDDDRWIEDGPGDRRYLDTQIAQDPELFLGGVAEHSDATSLTAADEEFKAEAQALSPDDQPSRRRGTPPAPSPFEALNRFRYYDPWLNNLLLADSLNRKQSGISVLHKPGEN